MGLNKEPYKYVEELSDGTLQNCVKESLAWSNVGALSGFEIRNLVKLMQKDIPLSEIGILAYLRDAVCREAAKRWLDIKYKKEE